MKSVRPTVAGKTRGSRFGSASLLAVVATLLSPAASAETSAGERISNVASLSARQGDRSIAARSNIVDLVTAERLDLTLVPVAQGGDVPVLVLTNGGNGDEAFVIRAMPADPAASVRGIAVDRDGDGRYDPTVDLLLSGPTPALAPGGQLRLIVLLDSDGGISTRLTVTADAVTGSGTPGTILSGAGDGGGDAVVGPTGASATVTLDAMSPGPGGGSGTAGGASLVKSQAVRAPDGSTMPLRDAIITYTLAARFTAAAAAARVDDPVPIGTSYVPGSLTLDGVPLSDAADEDAGTGDGRGVAVLLGDVAAGTARTIQFQVRIQ